MVVPTSFRNLSYERFFVRTRAERCVRDDAIESHSCEMCESFSADWPSGLVLGHLGTNSPSRQAAGPSQPDLPLGPDPSEALRGPDLGICIWSLVVRIARPTSLAVWHRRSHRRPNRSGSPNRKHFESLDLKTCRFFASQANIAGFSQKVFLVFLWFQIKLMGFRIASKKRLFRISSDLGVCDSNRIAHRGCIARFGPLRFDLTWTCNSPLSKVPEQVTIQRAQPSARLQGILLLREVLTSRALLRRADTQTPTR